MSATAARDVLLRVPYVYAELALSLVPGAPAPDGERVAGGGSVTPPAPANLDVADHRHQLVRGLRWWVDAVRDDDTPPRLGESVSRMAVYMVSVLPAMAAEDVAMLHENLMDWLYAAYPHMGKVEAPTAPVRLPLGAEDQLVSVKVAAQVLGVTTRTIQRRVPDRANGVVRLGDAMRTCVHDLLVGSCADCAA